MDGTMGHWNFVVTPQEDRFEFMVVAYHYSLQPPPQPLSSFSKTKHQHHHQELTKSFNWLHSTFKRAGKVPFLSSQTLILVCFLAHNISAAQDFNMEPNLCFA